jgi:large subunit ribosomal protein L22
MDKRASGPLKKAIDSAIANAVNNFKAEKEILSIKDIIVNEGVSMKRYHYAARGRIRPYKKRTSHIHVVLTDNKKSEVRSTSSGQAQNPKLETNLESRNVQEKTEQKGDSK